MFHVEHGDRRVRAPAILQIFMVDTGDEHLALQIVQQASHAVGRNYVIDCLQKDGSIVTEQQIRYRMLLLKQDGLLEVGRGRQGSVITPKGAAFLWAEIRLKDPLNCC